MAAKQEKDDISKLSFEEAIKELTGIVAEVEQGQIPLAESLGQYERGMALIRHCRTVLQEAEKRIDQISKQEQLPEGSGGLDF
jgi:exodeoxyribonuclease VII small subunit